MNANFLTRFLKRCLLGGFCLSLATLVVGLMAVSMFGNVRGEEFSPQTFSRRTFSYRQLPVFNIQITALVREPHQDALGVFLRTHKYIPPVAGKPTWDLTWHANGASPPIRADAAILTDYMDTTDTGSAPYWLTWSRSHPSIAKVLWPEAAELARRELYLLIPELFDLAQQAKTPNQLKQQWRKRLTARLGRLAEGDMANEQWTRAEELLQWGVQRDPQNAELWRRQMELYTQTGDTRKAQQAEARWRSSQDSDSTIKTEPE